MERYSNNVDVIDCSKKAIIPPLVNSCLKSEGTLIKYLMRNRGYEKPDEFLYTDFMFNYLYQEQQTEEMKNEISSIYNYSFARNLKSGVVFLNEFSLRKDASHLSPISKSRKMTSQKLNVCYPIKHDEQSLANYNELNPAYYLTDESQLTIYDISQISRQKKENNFRLFLEVSTNKEVSEKFKHTFNKPVITLLNEYGLIDESTSLINPIYLSYDEIRILSEKKSNIIICPSDLAYFSNRYFPIDEFVNNKIKFSIATGWLGDDLFDEVRIFRDKYKELNFTNEELLLSLIKTPREIYFEEPTPDEDPCCIAPNKIANLVFFDLSDVRFQLLPENYSYDKICSFIIDNLSSVNISEVMINGEFKIRENKALFFDEDEIIESAHTTRQKLYKVGKYKEITERTSRRENIERLDPRARDEGEIKLFSESAAEGNLEQSKDVKDEFRIKGKLQIFKHKTSSPQKSLFEDAEAGNVIQSKDLNETPEINLLFTEIDETKGIDDEIIYSKLADAKILKQAGMEKKKEKEEYQQQESKIELPKNVKLKFGDD